jgi:Flp pilus assembly protein TadG
VRRIRSEHGVSAVELAIVLVILFLVLFGIFQFGIAFHRDQGLEAAAREGARLASIGAKYNDIKQRVWDSQSLFTDSDVIVTTNPASSGTDRPCQFAGQGQLVTVTATVNPSPSYAIVIPLWGNKQITYSAVGKFRCEKTN